MTHRFSKRELVVFANPWVALDHKGRACGACACDPVHHTPDRRFVGAEVDMERTKLLRNPRPGDVLRSVPQDTVWKFDTGPVKLPITGYYKDKIRKGDLIAADAETAALAGIAFVDPTKTLAAAKASAIQAFDSMYGSGAYEHLEGERATAAKALEEAAKAAAEPAVSAPKAKKGDV